MPEDQIPVVSVDVMETKYEQCESLVGYLETSLQKAQSLSSRIARGVGGREVSLAIIELEYALFRARQANDLLSETMVRQL